MHQRNSNIFSFLLVKILQGEPLPSSYIFVPKHRILSEEETSKVLKKFGVDKSKLPAILETDAQAVALKAKVGQVIEISREDGSVYYRCVVSE